MADVFSRMMNNGLDNELLEGIESLDQSLPPNARMASLLNAALDGPFSEIKAIYYDTEWNLQGFVIGPASGVSVEGSVGWSTNVHAILDYSHAAIHIAGKAKEYLENIGHEVSTFVDKIINGKKMSRSLRLGEGYLSVFNQAGYVTKIELWYKMAGQQKKYARNTSAGFTTEMYIPSGARDIRLLVTGIATIDKERLDERFNSAAGIKKVHKAFGTIFNVAFTEISPT